MAEVVRGLEGVDEDGAAASDAIAEAVEDLVLWWVLVVSVRRSESGGKERGNR